MGGKIEQKTWKENGKENKLWKENEKKKIIKRKERNIGKENRKVIER